MSNLIEHTFYNSNLIVLYDEEHEIQEIKCYNFLNCLTQEKLNAISQMLEFDVNKIYDHINIEELELENEWITLYSSSSPVVDSSHISSSNVSSNDESGVNSELDLVLETSSSSPSDVVSSNDSSHVSSNTNVAVPVVPSSNVPSSIVSPSNVHSSYTLGEIGENLLFSLILSSCPTFVTERTNTISHVCDIHSTDEESHIKYVYEVKNKSQLTNDDLSKFASDIDNLKSTYPTYKIIGIFISLNAPIPKFGHLFINTDVCYISKDYVNKHCLKLIVNMYRNVFTKIKQTPDVERKEYIIPANVYKLLGQLKVEYMSIIESKSLITQQIEINKTSTSSMLLLLSKYNLQLEFINFINKEFLDIKNEVNVEQDDYAALCAYLKSTPKKQIKKSELLTKFPSITKLREMKLADIITNYRT